MPNTVGTAPEITKADKLAVLRELQERGPFNDASFEYVNLFNVIMHLGIASPDRVTLRAIAKYMRKAASPRLINRIKKSRGIVAQKLRDWNASGASTLAVEVSLPRGCSPLFRIRPGFAEIRLATAESLLDAQRETGDGRLYLHSWDGVRVEKGISHFQAAIDAEPELASAHAGLAEAYGQAAYWAAVRPSKLRERAAAAARAAVAADATSADAHWAMGSISASCLADNAGSETHFRTAVTLDPRNATALSLVGTTLLAPLGRFSEALDSADRAVKLGRDGSAYYRSNRGWVLFYAGQLDRAVAEWQESLARFPGAFSPTYGLACAWGELGKRDECLSLLESLLDRFPDQTELLALSAYYGARLGRPGEARRIVAALENKAKDDYVPALCLAIAHAGLAFRAGRPPDARAFERAFRLLETAHSEGDIRLRWLAVNPAFRLFRDHRDYGRLLNTLRLR